MRKLWHRLFGHAIRPSAGPQSTWPSRCKCGESITYVGQATEIIGPLS